MKNGIVRIIATASLFAAPCLVQADSLRCEGDLVQVGDNKAAVLKKCGEPMTKDSFCKPDASNQTNAGAGPTVSTTGGASGTATSVTVVPCEKVDEWTYNPGPGQFLTTLRFERGEVTSVKYGDRVP